MQANNKTLFDLDGRVALVTGGSRGLGLQIAEALGDYGATIAISARKQHELDAALAHLRARGIRAEAFAADASARVPVFPLTVGVSEPDARRSRRGIALDQKEPGEQAGVPFVFTLLLG